MDFICTYQRPARVAVASGDEPDHSHMSQFNDRLLAMETLLRTIARRSDASEGSIQSAPTPTSESTRLTSMGHSLDDAESGAPPFAGATHTRDLGQQGTAVEGAALHEDTVDGMGTITFSDEYASGHFGPTSNSAFFGHIANAIARRDKSASQLTRTPVPSQAPLDRISRPPSPRQPFSRTQGRGPFLDLPHDRYKMPPKPEIHQLVDAFFANFGRYMFPYIDRRTVLAVLAEMDLSSPSTLRPSWLCLLNTIMAFATSLGDSSGHPASENPTKSDIFLDRALHMVSKMQGRPANLETLQAMLLVTQYVQGTQRSAQTWNLQRLTVQIAYQIGVHSSSSLSTMTPLEREIRKRSWLMCFVLDKTCSMTYGRPLSIPNSNIQLDLPLDAEFEDFGQGGEPLATTPSSIQRSTVVLYTQSIKLYRILGDIIEQVYQNNTECDATAMSSSDVILRVLSIEKKLDMWKLGLAPNLQVNTQNELFELGVASIPSRLNAVVTLRYLNARILLHRPILERFLDHDRSKIGDPTDWAFLRRFGQGSLEVCIEAAAEMIDIIYSFSEIRHHLMTTWWFTIYYIFSSALVLFGGMIALAENELVLPKYQHQTLLDSLRKALRSLDKIGNGTHIAVRCQKYLEKFIQFASTTGRDQEASLAVVMDPELLSSVQADLELGSLGSNYDWGNLFAPTNSQFFDAISFTI
ncbi:hypothetical protein GQ53DRAFT_841035 [Thozetella sp. PMI_491]|nr:hypothetical protein GQ53DRAFT_841035 [Thozetella sp. PMI_491]